MLTDSVRTAITAAIADQFKITDVKPEITSPQGKFGDFATNVAFQLAGRLKRSPQEIATDLAASLKDDTIESAEAVSGFINITLHAATLWKHATAAVSQSLAGKVVVTEYSDPNPFKVLHAGHLYTSVVGDAISNLLEQAGATVHRVNFGGDVGLHVGKTLWAVIQDLGGELPDKLAAIPTAKRSEWMAKAYVAGTKAYDDDHTARDAIISLNKRIYQIHAEDDHSSDLAQIYWTCRQWSYDYFDDFYTRIGTHFEKYYPESAVADLGLATVKEQLAKGVFTKSEGAIIFAGEKYGLHNRVFITGGGLPTYEAKDVGLIMTKWQDYHFDSSVVITGNEQADYMAVVLKAIEQFAPQLAAASHHLTHGLVKLAGGAKMSSRKGNILRAVDVLDAAATANQKLSGKNQPEVTLAAVKYAFLKQRLGGDIIYDPEESVSLTGNSGPYLQYAHARARSILAKADKVKPKPSDQLEPAERSLLRQLMIYSLVTNQAVTEFLPHVICTYLYELSQEFNRFYEANQVIGDPREAVRLALVKRYADILQQGLGVLGIAAPDRI
jgi:arginyl-tRNA synthetase